MAAPTTLLPGLGPRAAVPQPRMGIDPTAAGLSAQEGWVLSRVDGHTSFGELCLITGLGEAQTVEILRRLAERGLIAVEGLSGGAAEPIRTPSGGVPVRGGTALVVDVPPTESVAAPAPATSP